MAGEVTDRSHDAGEGNRPDAPLLGRLARAPGVGSEDDELTGGDDGATGGVELVGGEGGRQLRVEVELLGVDAPQHTLLADVDLVRAGEVGDGDTLGLAAAA